MEANPVQPSSFDQKIQFYDKLFQITDVITAGSHPVLKLPLAATRQLEPLQATNRDVVGEESSVGSNSQANVQFQPEEQGQQQAATLTIPRSSAQPSSVPNSKQTNASGPSNNVSKPSPAEIEDEAASKNRRETQRIVNKRQQLEKKLKDQFNRPNLGGSKIDLGCCVDGPISFDTLQLHQRALAVVNASVSPQAHANTNLAVSPNSSFDENSYYSSQVNEPWSSGTEGGAEEGEIDPGTEPVQMTNGDLEQERRMEVGAGGRHVGRAPEPLLPGPPVIPRKPSSNRQHDRDSSQLGKVKSGFRGRNEGRGKSISKSPNRNTRGITAQSAATTGRVLQTNTLPDESYSPPSPGAFRKLPPGVRPDGRIPSGPRAMAALPTHNQSSRQRRESESYSPPAAPVPVVQNQIGEPAAPRPSRISPLAGRHPVEAVDDQHRSNGIARTNVTHQETQRPYTNEHSLRAHPYNSRPQYQDQQPRPPPPPPPPPPLPLMPEKGRRGRDGRDQPEHSRMPNSNLQGYQDRRKRGREHDDDGRGQNVYPQAPPNKRRNPQGYRGRPVQPLSPSPEPYIKPEPVSPPPLSTYREDRNPARIAPRLRAPYPDPDVQIVSPRQAGFPRLPSEYERRHDEDVYLNRRAEPHRIPDRVPSSSARSRRPIPNDLELRRVASLQNAYQLSPRGWEQEQTQASPRSAYPQASSGYASYTLADQEQGSPTFHTPTNLSSQPKKRLIILENGDEWVAVPNTRDRRQSLGPEQRSVDNSPRYVDHSGSQLSPYQNSSPRTGEKPRRRRVIEIDDEDDDYQLMPPPPPVYMPSQPAVDTQLRRALSYAPDSRPRASSLQPIARSREISHGPTTVDRRYESGPGLSARRSVMHQPARLERQSYYHDFV